MELSELIESSVWWRWLLTLPDGMDGANAKTSDEDIKAEATTRIRKLFMVQIMTTEENLKSTEK